MRWNNKQLQLRQFSGNNESFVLYLYKAVIKLTERYFPCKNSGNIFR